MGNNSSNGINDLQNALAQCGSNQHIDIGNIVMVCNDGSRLPINVKKLNHPNSNCENCQKNEHQDVFVNISDDFKREDVEYLIQCVYSSQIPDLNERIGGILFIVKGIKSLEFQLQCFATIEDNVNTQNVLSIWKMARHHECLSLEKFTKQYILDNFEEVIEDKRFLTLELDLVDELLKSDDIHVISEEKVFEALKIWVEADSENRKRDFCSLLKHIRLVLLSPEFCVDTVFPMCEPCQECYEVIKNFLKWTFIPEMRPELRSVIATNRKFGFALLEVIANTSFVFENIDIYDIDSESWEFFADIDTKLACSSVTALEDKIILLGGKNQCNQSSNQAWCMTISTKEVITMSSMQQNRHLFSSSAIADNIIVCGGQNDISNSLNTVEIWNPQNDTWKYLSSMFQERRSHAATVCNNQLYVIGGFSDGEYLDSVEKYDMKTNIWSDVPSMKYSRRGHGVKTYIKVATLNNYIYVIGGYNGEFLSSVEKFDTSTDCWSEFVDIPVPQGGSAVCFLGEIIFFGDKQILSLDLKTEKWKPFTSSSGIHKSVAVVVKSKYIKDPDTN